jgi:prolyl-tRNA synthetase
MQAALFNAAKTRLQERTRDCNDYADYKANVAGGGFYSVHWCGQNACEKRIQDETKSTFRGIPLDAADESGVCIVCGAPSSRRVIASQAY